MPGTAATTSFDLPRFKARLCCVTPKNASKGYRAGRAELECYCRSVGRLREEPAIGTGSKMTRIESLQH